MDSQEFIAAMGEVCTGVTVVTTDGTSGRYGVTVSAMSAVSAAPPQLLVCINQRNLAAAAVEANRRFCVNVLGLQHQELAEIFAGRLTQADGDRFAGARWEQWTTGSPVLADAVAAFDCVVEQQIECATHRLFVGRVVAARAQGSGDALAYVRRTFWGLRALSSGPSL